MKFVRFAAVLAAITALAALVCTPAGSGASTVRGYVEIYLDDFPDAFTLDQPGPATIVVHNHSNIVLKNSEVVMSSASDLVGSTPACTRYNSDVIGHACMWKIRWVKPGGTVRYHLTLMFKSSDYPNAIVPGTNSNEVELLLQVHNKFLPDHIFAPVHLKTG